MADMATTELAADTGKDIGNPKRGRALRVLGGVVVIAARLAGACLIRLAFVVL